MNRTDAKLRRGMLVAALFLSGCAVGPDYKRPPAATPASFQVPPGWKIAEAHDADIPADWWQLFHDPLLGDLERRVAESNQTLAQKDAALRQARALVQTAQAGLFPTLNLNAGSTRNRASAGAIGLAQGMIYDNYLLSTQASWEPDLWGSVRRTIESNTAAMQASAGQLAATRLSLQSQLAADYFQLRADDSQKRLLADTVAAYRQSLTLTQSRFEQGVAAKTDVLQAEAQLRSTEAQLLDVGVQRAQLEHAIAVLVGTPPSDFHIPESTLDGKMPAIPLTVPSVLLERRPDIAAAERSAAAASAQIGVAKAAFFPALTLNGSYGFQNRAYSNLVTQPNNMWAFSPQILQPLFDAGLRAAAVDQAVASYDQSVANYREVVLEAFQNVEDNLAAASILSHEIEVQRSAVESARQTLVLTESQYREGVVGYLNVLSAQTTLLTSELTELSLRSREYVASVQLIVALGGGWDHLEGTQPDTMVAK
ncbi:MAG: efflux transporter outer membrane subunit [Betaproteobacteria bacterium]|nr:efflux transporter outer membrane subunit [Betaproteobacteria bacterium]MDE2131922.1 efflux transporter outer membrane subunit [Betaproteobacteria bacterium]